MKFEGEYLNGEKINGKLYNINGNLYCNLAIANGLIKEYDYYGRLIFEGEYLNGKRNGVGKEYNELSGKLKFEGEYLNDKKNGKGKEYTVFHVFFTPLLRSETGDAIIFWDGEIIIYN